MCRGTYDEHLYGTEDYDCQKLPLWQDDGYTNGWSAGPGNFPCHVPCLKMLARAITGSEDFHQLDIYSLHREMARLNRDGGRALNLDYGDTSELDQTWESHPGEEVRKKWLPAIGAHILRPDLTVPHSSPSSIPWSSFPSTVP